MSADMPTAEQIARQRANAAAALAWADEYAPRDACGFTEREWETTWESNATATVASRSEIEGGDLEDCPECAYLGRYCPECNEYLLTLTSRLED